MKTKPELVPPASDATFGKSVPIIGLDPALIGFTDPSFAAFPGLNADKVTERLTAGQASLNALGYDADLCLNDFGQRTESVGAARLSEMRCDCVMIGAGVRTGADLFIPFEKLINIVHEHAPNPKICFNTKPSGIAEAVRRWT